MEDLDHVQSQDLSSNFVLLHSLILLGFAKTWEAPPHTAHVCSSLIAAWLRIYLWYQIVRVQISGLPLTITSDKLCNPLRAQLAHQKKGNKNSSYIKRLLYLLKEYTCQVLSIEHAM